MRRPRGTIADPRGALDMLRDDNAISDQEYEAGLMYARLSLLRSRRGDEAIFASEMLKTADTALGQLDREMPELVRRVCVGHAMPGTVDRLQRLGSALRRLSAHFEMIELALLFRPEMLKAA